MNKIHHKASLTDIEKSWASYSIIMVKHETQSATSHNIIFIYTFDRFCGTVASDNVMSRIICNSLDICNRESWLGMCRLAGTVG